MEAFSIKKNFGSNLNYMKNNPDSNHNEIKNEKQIKEDFSLILKAEQLPKKYSFKNISKMIRENNSHLEKDFEIILEETFSKDKLKFADFDESIIDNKNLALKYLNLNPYYSVYSTLHQNLYILVSLKSKNNNSNLIDYFLYIFEKDKSVRKIKLLFNDKNLKNNGKNRKFVINKIIIHPKNQNQLCFCSFDSIAFIENLDKLKLIKSNSEMEIDMILDLFGDVHNKSISYNSQITILKFSFWDFDNHFGILTSEGLLRVYCLSHEEHSFNFKNVINISLNEFLRFDEQKNALNFVDFEFGRCNIASIWEAFSIFFLDASGRIFYCSPIFPEEININYIMPFSKMKRFLRTSSNLNRNKNNNSARELKITNENIEKNKEEYDPNYDIDLANENIINNFIDLEKSQVLGKNNEGKISIAKINLHEKKSINHQRPNSIRINDYLRAFNKQQNIYLKEIDIIDRRHSLDKAKLNYDLISSKCNESTKNLDYTKGNYTELRILNTYPITIIRIYRNENIDFILMDNQPKPIRQKNDKQKIDGYLIDTKIFKLKMREEEIGYFDEKIFNMNQYNNNSTIQTNKPNIYDKFFSHQNINRKLNIIENHMNPSKLIISFLNDMYVLNLNFLKDISNRFLFEKKTVCYSELSNKNYCFKIDSELIPILKINYSKIKDYTNKKFSYLGISLIPKPFYEKAASTKEKKDKNSDKIIILGYNDNNNLFAKEFQYYENIEEIFSENNCLNNRNSQFSKFIADKKEKRGQYKDLDKFSFKINDFRRSFVNKNVLENINLVRKMLNLNPNIDNILELNFSEDDMIKKELIKINDEILESSLTSFDSPIVSDTKKIYDHYYNKLSSFSNAFKNRLNYYQNFAITVKKINFPNKQKNIKKIIEKIDIKLKEIKEKEQIIKHKFVFVKSSIIELINSDKEILEGKISCKNFLINKINLINNLKIQFKNLEQVMMNLNSNKVALINQKLFMINMNFIDDEKIKKAFIFKNSISQYFEEIKKELIIEK